MPVDTAFAAEALAGWRFDVDALDAPDAPAWLRSVAATAQVDLFASTHTCLPAMRRVSLQGGSDGWVVNNGAAGMPNFTDDLSGLITRVGVTPSPHPAINEIEIAGTYVALSPVRFDVSRWRSIFLEQWPAGSDAWVSYFQRITQGPAYTPERALSDPHSR